MVRPVCLFSNFVVVDVSVYKMGIGHQTCVVLIKFVNYHGSQPNPIASQSIKISYTFQENLIFSENP